MLFIDYLISILKTSKTNHLRKQVIFIINEIILGIGGIGINSLDKNNIITKKKIEDESSINYIINEYFSPHLWNLQTNNISDFEMKEKLLTIDQLNDNIILISLLLEGVGNIAEIMGTNFDNYLVHIFYNIVEKLGDYSSMVSQSGNNFIFDNLLTRFYLKAWTTLYRISKICGYNSIHDLISKNLDYIIDKVYHHMNHLHEYPQTPLVLKGNNFFLLK